MALGLTVAEAVVHTFKSSLGPGCLSLPFAVSRAGLAFLPAMVLLQGCCVYNIFLLVTLKQTLQLQPRTSALRSYGDLAFAVFGPAGRGCVDAFVSLQQLGICTVYFSFASTNLRTLLIDLSLAPWLPPGRAGTNALICIIFPLVAVIAQIRSWKRLAPLAAVANLLVIGGVGVVFALTVWQLSSAGMKPAEQLPAANPEALPILFGQVVYSFEYICNVLPIENSLQHPHHMRTVLAISQAAYVGVQLATAVLPVLAFGFISSGSISDELESRFSLNPLVMMMNGMITLAVLLTYPVQFYSAVEVIETRLGLVHKSTDEVSMWKSDRRLNDEPTAFSEASPDSPDISRSRSSSFSASTEMRRLLSTSLNVHPSRFANVARSALRLCLVGGTAVIAISVPQLGIAIALFGSLNAPMLTLVMPVLLANRLLTLSPARKLMHHLIMAIGVVGSIAGTTNCILNVSTAGH